MSDNTGLAPYRARRTWLLDVCEIAGWQLKVYGITVDGRDIPQNIITAALDTAKEMDLWPDRNGPRFGFLTIHAGEQAIWLLIDLWVDDIMYHFLFNSPVSAPTEFGPGPKDGTTACVWELEVTKHERDAWVRHVLAQPTKPDFEGYLKDCVEIDSPQPI